MDHDQHHAVETLLAERQIRDVIARYARGVDRQDGDQIRDCFHPNAMHHYGVFDGHLDEFIPWVLAEVSQYSRTMHFMGSSIIDWPDSRPGPLAIVETYAIVLHQKDGGDKRDNWVGGIRYIDRLELRSDSGRWKISERTVVGDWLRIDPTANHRHFREPMRTGRTSPEDEIFQVIAQAIT